MYAHAYKKVHVQCMIYCPARSGCTRKDHLVCFFHFILEDFTSPTSYLGFSFAELKKDGSWLVEVGYGNRFCCEFAQVN